MKKNRNHSTINRLPSHIRETVDEMIKSDFTYSEIAEFIRKNGTKISISSVQRYASGLNETLENLRLAHENFRMIMAECDNFSDSDITDAILILLQNQILSAINSQKSDVENLDKLIKNTSALIRAVAFKKQIEINSEKITKDFNNLIFEAIAGEKPQLYAEIKRFIEGKAL
ncbi:MAG: DUF3486 family protein [Ruminococcus sp.]|nr:DUF3486 family protein [Ruminococcus sp.]